MDETQTNEQQDAGAEEFNLFVGNLAWATDEASLTTHFSTVGTVKSANVIKDKMTNKSRGFGFVIFGTKEEADAAKQLNGTELDGRTITVDDARPQQPRNEGNSEASY